MQVDKELRTKIHEAVMITLDSFSQEKDIDDRLVNAVVEVIEVEVSAPQQEPSPGLVPVRYVGRRPEYSDGNFSTGTWLKDQTKMVTDSVASRMLEHKDVYVPGEADKAKEIIEPQGTEKKKDDEDENLQDARASVQNMTRKEAVRTFVADNFNGLQIPAEHEKLADMKTFAIQQIDLYHLP